MFGSNRTLKNNQIYPHKKIKRDRIVLKCAWDECDNDVEKIKDRKKLKFCSNSCRCKWNNKYSNSSVLGGRATRDLEIRRSKNEIHFANLCLQYFKNVKTNEAIFNGWDADVVIEDLKVAVLWNGIWHYKKITKKHSLKQTKNRDKIKKIEVEKLGYTPYIIKDLGKYDVIFVEEEFKKFLKKFKITC